MKLNNKDYTCYSDEALLFLLKKGDMQAFNAIYERYDTPLRTYLARLVQNKDVAEDLHQNVFLSLWNNGEKISIRSSLKVYLFGACKNRFLDYIRAAKVRREYIDYITLFSEDHVDNSTEERVNLSDLLHTMERSMSQLSKKCQTVFRLSRVEHMSISCIASQMNISHRTVENYLSQALKHLRSSLGDFMALLAFVAYL